MSKSLSVMFSVALHVEREALKHSGADLRRVNETQARIHDDDDDLVTQVSSFVISSWNSTFKLSFCTAC